MIKLKKSTQTSLLLGHFTLFFLLMGCWGGAQSELPDAPPPYPNSPYFQGSFYKASIHCEKFIIGS